MLQEPTDIVLSRSLADQLDAEIGDIIRLNDADVDFTVRGIVPSEVAGSTDSFKIAAGVVGFYYLDLRAVDYFEQMPHRAELVFLRLRHPRRLNEINRAIRAEFPYFRTVTTNDLKEQNSELGDTIIQLVSIMGLVSMLIGGIGIVNTMMVMVRRRIEEIAVLKTVGLRPEEVTILFLIEAMIIGLLGSVVGVLFGWVVAYLMQNVVAAFMAQSLEFRLTAGPAITGFIVGVLVTTVFGFLPTMAAGQVRPGLVLHPKDMIIPPNARVQLATTLILVLLVLSLIAHGMIGDLGQIGSIGSSVDLIAGFVGLFLGLLITFLISVQERFLGRAICGERMRCFRAGVLFFALPALGFAFGYFFPSVLILFTVFAAVGVLYILLWMLIWVIGHFSPGWMQIDLKMAMRSMFARRGRNASTLVALVVGVFILSLMTFLVDALRQRFVEQLVQETGGNVIIYAQHHDMLDEVESRLTEDYGPNSYAVVLNYKPHLISMVDSETGETLTARAVEERVSAHFQAEAQRVEALRATLEYIDSRDVDSNLPDFEIYRGRQLNAADAGQPVIVIAATDETLAAGMSIGDLLTFQLESEDADGHPNMLTLEIVGMTDRRNSLVSGISAPNYVPLGIFPDDEEPKQIRVIMDTPDSELPQLRENLSDLQGIFVLETKSLNDLMNRVVDQFTTFPLLVAGLALFTGGVVIANSVALSTMERRRDIATMKAVGLERWRVLEMLLLEYGIMGLIGGLIGVGIAFAMFGVVLLRYFQFDPGHSLPYATVMWLMSLCVLIALVAALLSAWDASGEKPLNVLRYK
jgi:ABC-type antimicrobial peptide transport system permease subunit